MKVTIDDVRRYWDDRPCNVRHSPKEIGTLEYYDEVEAKRYYAEPHIPNFADFHPGKERKFWKLVVVWQQRVLTLHGMVLLILAQIYQKSL